MACGLFLSGTTQADVESTGNQAFGGQCFRGSGGAFAVSIDLGYLLEGPTEAADLAAIQAASVDWIELTDVQFPTREA